MTGISASCRCLCFLRLSTWRIGVLLALLATAVSVMNTATAQRTSSIPTTKPQFTNIAKSAGINFVHTKGKVGAPMILTEMTPGVCVADFDGDGWPDFYIVNGGDIYKRGPGTRNALYHNNGDGTFTDVTEIAGVPGTSYGLGCVWGDYDNDGRPDLFVTQYGQNVLYHNNGDGTFTDVTAKAGVGGLDFGTAFHTGAVFFDFDRDGLLDLYVGGYVSFGPDSPQQCMIFGVLTSCAPSAYNGSPNILYHNNGDGTFTNVTKQSGVYMPNGKNLSVGVADYDNDGWPDLFVANDGQNANLFHNQPDGTFKEVGLVTGMAVAGQGSTMAAMCVSLGDYNDDGWLDLYISDWQGSSDHLWLNDSHGGFEEVSDSAGIMRTTREHLSFGGGFFDYDNDGWLDLFIANGHVFPGIDKVMPGVHYRQSNSLFHNDGKGTFLDVSRFQGSSWQIPALGRGVAFADFDNDGYVDILVGNDGDPPALLHNNGGTRNHFVSFKLVGVKSNRDAIGARIRLQSGGISQIREIEGGGSYLSQSDLRASFGLGSSTDIDLIDVSWPSGAHQTFRHLAADKFYQIIEGKESVDLQPIARRMQSKRR